MYQMHEALARERQREQREQAAQRRLASEVASVRLWQRLAHYASRRAARSSRRLAEHSAADYSLVG
jgi:muconolactone delta-isomerase